MARGERLFIHGPSGSGKTTLLSLLGGIILPTQGVIEVLGTSLAALSSANRDRFRADHIGFVFQMFNLIPYLSLLDNVSLPCQFSAARRRRAERPGVDLTQAAADLLQSMGLNPAPFAGRPANELSVGQQQRVAAARALIGSPGLIIADEPTSALDTDTRAAFLDTLFRQAEQAGATIVFVSHDRSLAASFDRSVALGDLNRTPV